jgi:hypothetical protein
MLPESIAHRLKWRFIMHQTSRPILASPPPAAPAIQRFLAMERTVVETIYHVCPTMHTSLLEPVERALDCDIETHGVRDPVGRHALFLTSLQHHLLVISPYEAMAWWFVVVLTHAVGAWGTVDGMTYFHPWISDATVSTLEDILDAETQDWTWDQSKACLDELDYAIRYRTAMVAMLLDGDDDTD